MKTQRTRQKLTVVSSESSNSELLSDENNDQINELSFYYQLIKLKPVCDQDLLWLDFDIEMQNLFEIQDLFLPDINAETLSEISSEIQDSVISSSNNEILQKSSNSESFLEDEFFTNTTSDDFSDSKDNYLVDKFSTYTELDNNISEEFTIALRLFRNERDVALVVSIDGYQIFRQKTDNCWVVAKNLNTFLYPMIKELQNLKESIKCYDAIRKESFTLRAAVINWSDETPGLTKLMCITGHNIYQGYCASNLPSRTHEEWKERLKTIHNAKSEKERSELITNYGINKNSILFDLLTIHFLDSFTVDIMHLFYENIAKYMFNHWTGTFFSDELQNKEPYILKKSVWNDIGKQMHAFRKDLPSKLGRLLCNIMLYNRGYKAEEWAA
ncbi:16292_t:CDS:2 [Gigaspora rosea]|nr:16292_t:CDS:2 [Gigaspora rosea]